MGRLIHQCIGQVDYSIHASQFHPPYIGRPPYSETPAAVHTFVFFRMRFGRAHACLSCARVELPQGPPQDLRRTVLRHPGPRGSVSGGRGKVREGRYLSLPQLYTILWTEFRRFGCSRRRERIPSRMIRFRVYVSKEFREDEDKRNLKHKRDPQQRRRQRAVHNINPRKCKNE